jgi:hypothetical protein
MLFGATIVAGTALGASRRRSTDDVAIGNSIRWDPSRELGSYANHQESVEKLICEINARVHSD